MTLDIHETDDGFDIEGDPCPDCGGEHTLYDRTFGYWKCEDCSRVWGRDIDDPDYEEVEAEIPDYATRLNAHIEADMSLHQLMQEREGDRP